MSRLIFALGSVLSVISVIAIALTPSVVDAQWYCNRRPGTCQGSGCDLFPIVHQGGGAGICNGNNPMLDAYCEQCVARAPADGGSGTTHRYGSRILCMHLGQPKNTSFCGDLNVGTVELCPNQCDTQVRHCGDLMVTTDGCDTDPDSPSP